MENKKVTEVKSRKRRTKKEVEEIVWKAFERLVLEGGFNSVTLVKLAREAGVEPPVIYKRFEDMDDLLEQYVRKNDFWLSKNSIVSSMDPALSPKENLANLMSNVIDNLYENEIMQRILLWGLNDTHKITRQMAMLRDLENIALIDYFKDGLRESGLNINIVNAILLTSIYYLVMHKRISTFCMVNFNREESKEELKKTIHGMVDRMF